MLIGWREEFSREPFAFYANGQWHNGCTTYYLLFIPVWRRYFSHSTSLW